MKRLSGIFLIAFALLAAPVAMAQTVLQDGTVFTGHAVSAGNIPVLTSCGTTPALGNGATDMAGTVTTGTTSTGCVITFAKAYATAPTCIVQWIATPLASQSYATSTTAITITQTSASNNVIKYFCLGISGN